MRFRIKFSSLSPSFYQHAFANSENEMLKRFWEIESEARYGKKRILTQEEQLCEEFYNQTI